MAAMQNAAETLEFPKIQEILAEGARTERGRALTLSLTQLEKTPLVLELSYVQEAIDLLSRYGSLPVDGSADLRKSVDYASRGGRLNEKELSDVAEDCHISRAVKAAFDDIQGLPKLWDYASFLPDLSDLEKDIRKAIGPDLSVLDEASRELKSIRIKKRRLQEKTTGLLPQLLTKYKPYLSGMSFALKNGHYALPVANAYKSKVRGFVQDFSSSGETVFIEPEELLRLHAEIQEAENQEKEEIERILQALSLEVGHYAERLLDQNERIARLDFWMAKARFAEKYHGHVAHVSDKREISIPAARHPLLKQETAVPNDFFLSEAEPLMVISGPNAGGKTVALKTLGLLVLMHQSGLPIPAASGAEICPIDHVYTDIGDQQSIEESLSTFAAHMRSSSDIFKQATSRDLVLLDEIGTGTAPQEGEAIAYASVKCLLDKGCFALVSSHFNGLKAYALQEKRIVSASMLFDQEKLAPTYRLKRGLPGESYAFEVAEKYGMPASLVEEARNYLGEGRESEQSRSSKRLLELVVEQEKTLQSIEQEKKALEEQEAKNEALAKSLEKEKEEFQKKEEEKERRLLEKTKAQVSEIVSILSKPDVKLHEAIEAKRKIEELEAASEEEGAEEPFFHEELKEGDYVEIPSINARGKVLRVNGKNVEVRASNGLSFTTSREKVHQVGRPPEVKKKPLASVDRVLSSPVPLEVNLIGMRAEEAKGALIDYLDSCRMAGHKRVRIIHGIGSGVLRRVVESYLKAHPEFVASYETADQYEGGLGATIAHLK